MPVAPIVSNELFRMAVVESDPAARAAVVAILNDEVDRHSRRIAKNWTEKAVGNVPFLEIQEARDSIAWTISKCTKVRLNLPNVLKNPQAEQTFFGRRSRWIRSFAKGQWPRLQREIRVAATEVCASWIDWDKHTSQLGIANLKIGLRASG